MIMSFVMSLRGSPTDANNVRSIRTPAIIVAFACNKVFASISTACLSLVVVVVFAKSREASNKVAS